jgi:hypothetical protein
MVELPKGKERWQRFMNLVREVHAYVDAGDFSEASEPSVKAPDVKPEPVKPSEPVKPTAVQSAYAREARLYYEGVQLRRAFVRGRKGVESLDSMRIVIDGVAAILQGVPKEALWSAIEAPWPTETRNQCRNFRPTAADLKPVAPEGYYDYSGFAPRPSTFAHGVSEYVLRLAARTCRSGFTVRLARASRALRSTPRSARSEVFRGQLGRGYGLGRQGQGSAEGVRRI